jgi:hypothetical protein
MLKRASMWLVLGSVTGLLAVAGLPPVLTRVTEILFYACAGFAALSLLFSLFEEADEIEEQPEPEAPRLWTVLIPFHHDNAAGHPKPVCARAPAQQPGESAHRKPAS